MFAELISHARCRALVIFNFFFTLPLSLAMTIVPTLGINGGGLRAEHG